MVLLSDDGDELAGDVAVAALAVGVGGVEIDAVAGVQLDVAIPEGENERPFQHVVELLAVVAHQLGRLVARIQDDQQRLHDLAGVAAGHVLVVIPGETLDLLGLAATHQVVGVQLRRGAREDLGEVDVELAGHVVDGRDGDVLAGLLPAAVGVDIDAELLGHSVARHVAGLAQALQALAQIFQVLFFHVRPSILSRP